MIDANQLTTIELMELAIVWYCNAQFELVYQVADHLEAVGFDRMEIMQDIRKGNRYIY